MQKYILESNNKEQAIRALIADDLFTLISNFETYLRNVVKYGTSQATIEDIYKEFLEMKNDVISFEGLWEQ